MTDQQHSPHKPAYAGNEATVQVEIKLIRYLECVASVLRTEGRYVSQADATCDGHVSSAALALNLLSATQESESDTITTADKWRARNSLDWAKNLPNPDHTHRKLSEQSRIGLGLIGHAAKLVFDASNRNFRSEPDEVRPEGRPERCTEVKEISSSPRRPPIFLEGKHSALLFRGIASAPILLQSATIIGRTSQADVTVESELASRVHAAIELVGPNWYVSDLQSSNGTFLNDVLIEPGPHQLTDEDELLIGDQKFYFVIVDREALTGGSLADAKGQSNLSKFLFLQRLMHALTQSQKDESNFSLVVVEINDFQLSNSSLGRSAGDKLLDEMARRLREHFPDSAFISRLHGSCFALLLSNVDQNETAHLITTFIDASNASPLQIEKDFIPLRVTAVFADAFDFPLQLLVSGNPELVVQVFERFLHRTRRAGKSVASATMEELERVQHARSVLSADLFQRRIKQSLNDRHYTTVCAIALTNDKRLVEVMGPRNHAQCFGELVDLTDSCLPHDAIIATWDERIVLIALPPNVDSETLLKKLQAAWTRENDKNLDLRRLSTMTRPAAVIAAEGGLDALLGEVHASNLKTPDPLHHLPYPAAAPIAAVQAHVPGIARMAASYRAVEMVLRLLVAVSIGTILQQEDDELNLALAQHLKPLLGQPLTMGKWNGLNHHLIRLVQRVDDAALAPLFDRWTHAARKASLKGKIDQAIAFRNTTAHKATLPGNPYQEESEFMEKMLAQLLDVLEPLQESKLITTIKSEFVDEELTRYQLRLHRGIATHFPVIEWESNKRLLEKWCYLLPDDTADPLCLAPLFLAQSCTACGGIEVLLADGFHDPTKPKKALVTGLMTTHSVQVDVAEPLSWRRFESRYLSGGS